MKSLSKVFVATSSFSELSPILINKFKKKKIIIKKNPLHKKLTGNQLIKYAKDCEYIIAGTETYNQEILDKMGKLKFIFRLGSGIDNIDIGHLKKKKIKFKKSKITPEIAVAELIIGYIFLIYRNINNHNNNLKKKLWKKKMGYTLNGKTLGIIGFGKVGKYLYKIAKCFGVKILVNDKKKIYLKNTNLNFLIKNSDIISLNASIKSNKQILNKKNLKLCKKNSIIINTSRPEMIDYDYLYLMLKKKKFLALVWMFLVKNLTLENSLIWIMLYLHLTSAVTQKK